MLRTYAELEAQFKRRVAYLQKRCPHTEADTLAYERAPGHYDGRVKVCRVCSKHLEYIPSELHVTITSSTNADPFTIFARRYG